MFVKVFHTVFDVFGVGESRNGKVCRGSTKRAAVTNFLRLKTCKNVLLICCFWIGRVKDISGIENKGGRPQIKHVCTCVLCSINYICSQIIMYVHI